MQKEIKLVLSGGHAATTAVAVVEAIISAKKNWKIYFIGAKNALEGSSMPTLESEALPKLGVKYLPLTTGRLQRKLTVWTIPSLLKTPFGLLQAFYYLLKVRPGAILSFGGYAAFPVVFAAKSLGIPIILHEQTSVAGRVNRLSAKWADKIALARTGSASYFPKDKCVVTGNPIMREVAKVKSRLTARKLPTIYITGGSRGSQAVNEAVGGALRSLLVKYRLIHQTGSLDYRKFSEIKEALPMALKANYRVFARVRATEVASIYKEADIIVSRAGANTVSEIMAVKRPAILIPLPISYLDEQMKNAKIARDFGIAEILPQDKLTPGLLSEKIDSAVGRYSRIVGKIRSKDAPDFSAAKKVLAILSSYVK